MANQEHLDILKKGVETWNQWRREHPDIKPDLIGASLESADLRGIDFSGVIPTHDDIWLITEGDLSPTELGWLNHDGADLRGANLNGADLKWANLSGANFSGTSFIGASLAGANFSGATLEGADFTHAYVGSTIFGRSDLRLVKGLDSIVHQGPSTIGIDTIYLSHAVIPDIFLKGAGVSDTLIAYASSLVSQPFDYYTCFISYSSKDQAFAQQLYADLQSNGVRCWFASENMKIGDKIRTVVDQSISMYNKLLLVLSKHSIMSTWVTYEVEKALNKEPEGIANVLYPIRLDDVVMQCKAGWADDIRRTRHIGDFTKWESHDDYLKAFDRLLHDLKPEAQKMRSPDGSTNGG